MRRLEKLSMTALAMLVLMGAACGKKSDSTASASADSGVETGEESPAPELPSPSPTPSPSPDPEPKKTSEPVEPPKKEAAPQRNPFSLEAIVEPLPRANLYKVKLHWSGEATHWDLRRTDDHAYQKILYSGQGTELEDTGVVAGTSYRYELRGASLEPVASIEAKIPRDLELNGIDLPSVRGIHRLFLEAGAVLTARDQPTRIEVDEIVAPEATLQTFAPDQRAAPGKEGRAGNELRVIAKKATGHLVIVARGESGGNGVAGAAGANGKPGFLGSPGKYFDSDVGSVSLCEHSPSDGGDGGPGENGKRGGDGGRGGDSSPLLVEIADASALSLSTHPEPGVGGRGGPGGMPGQGGTAGEAGLLPSPKYKVLQPCHSASRGRSGPPGKQGPDGNPGERGHQGPVCLRLNGERTGECEVFEAASPRYSTDQSKEVEVALPAKSRAVTVR